MTVLPTAGTYAARMTRSALDDDAFEHEFTRRLHAINQRVTPRRRALLGALRSFNKPVAIAELRTQLPGEALSSLYRNLEVLMRAGVVERIVTSGDFARFELAEVVAEHHHHVICEQCGAIEDIDAPHALEDVLHDTVAQVSTTSAFTITGHRLDLLGLCPACQAVQPSAVAIADTSASIISK